MKSAEQCEGSCIMVLAWHPSQYVSCVEGVGKGLECAQPEFLMCSYVLVAAWGIRQALLLRY
jgi:hypothetical protein